MSTLLKQELVEIEHKLDRVRKRSKNRLVHRILAPILIVVAFTILAQNEGRSDNESVVLLALVMFAVGVVLLLTGLIGLKFASQRRALEARQLEIKKQLV